MKRRTQIAEERKAKKDGQTAPPVVSKYAAKERRRYGNSAVNGSSDD